MNDKRPDLPYEKATEETIGKGLDLVHRAAPGMGDAYNFVIGDRIREQRARNAEDDARDKAHPGRAKPDTQALPEDLVDPLLETRTAR